MANKNGILYTFNRNNLAAGPVWQKQIAIGGDCPTCGDGTIASGIFANGTLYYAGGQQRRRTGTVGGGRSPRSTPAPATILWSRPDRAAHPRLARLRQRDDRRGPRATPSRCSTPPTASCCTPTCCPARRTARSRSPGASSTSATSTATCTPSACPARPRPRRPTRTARPASPARTSTARPVAGSEQTTGGVLTVTAAGAAIKGTGDQFRFISQPVTGDSQASAQITVAERAARPAQQAGADGPAEHATRRRRSTPSCPTPTTRRGQRDSDIVVWYRTAFGATGTAGQAACRPTSPIYLMIQRQGNTVQHRLLHRRRELPR